MVAVLVSAAEFRGKGDVQAVVVTTSSTVLAALLVCLLGTAIASIASIAQPFGKQLVQGHDLHGERMNGILGVVVVVVVVGLSWVLG